MNIIAGDLICSMCYGPHEVYNKGRWGRCKACGDRAVVYRVAVAGDPTSKRQSPAVVAKPETYCGFCEPLPAADATEDPLEGVPMVLCDYHEQRKRAVDRALGIEDGS